MPKRVQMSRQHPWRAEHPDAVIVARPSRWGNPLPGGIKSLTREQIVYGYRDLVVRRAAKIVTPSYVITVKATDVHETVPTSAEIRTALAGKDLACWCKPGDPCHADVLLEIANAPEPDRYPTQEFLHGESDVPGDCWRACIAGLTNAPLEVVPHFAQLYPDETTPAWWYATVTWVEENAPGTTLVCIDPVFPVATQTEALPPVVIATGKSPRGDFMHAVLVDWVTGDLVWDPHPSRAGLAGPAIELAALQAHVTGATV
ncbi:DUF4326 domain-containing protein [Demequina sp. TTPB684]|uniref:DUF4326 domain-containing protein n=1 Tax=unclassified Demequina TaxID=2620311 RepID=UPI001CF21498|nr:MULTISPECIES: DUF4326 domain-containing protein [unclassified Demequina]MCB2412378.1 DUF4326 domain-containing protein [Demequina sp. TTPB684]UPU89048.1 DUF4326 domain-containing protein [Demequina sp. TMPB413]